MIHDHPRPRPRTRHDGWGVIHADGNRLRHIANGQIKTDPSMPLPRRLSNLHAALVDVILAERPDGAAVEEVLGNTNAQSTLKLGQARGVVLLAAASAGLHIGEYHPSTVKKAWSGRAARKSGRSRR
jgi:crossover junction endodeoxyribonuclease RuvC